MIRKQINRIVHKVLDWSRTEQKKDNYAPLRKAVRDSFIDKFLLEFTGKQGEKIREAMTASEDAIRRAREKGDEQQVKILEAHKEGYLKGMTDTCMGTLRIVRNFN